MRNNRSDPSPVPGDPKLTDQTLLKEADLQRRTEVLQCIICGLLVENEKLRQRLVVESIFIEGYRTLIVSRMLLMKLASAKLRTFESPHCADLWRKCERKKYHWMPASS